MVLRFPLVEQPPEVLMVVKRKKGSPRMKQLGYRQLTLWLTENELKQFKALCDKNGVSYADLVRRLLSNREIKL